MRCSLLDVMAGRPLAEALADMPLPVAINDALLGTDNRARQVLTAVVAYEQGQWSEGAAAMDRLELPVDALPDVYSDALRWARELTNAAQAA